MSENSDLKFAGATGEPEQGSSVESVNPSKVVDALVEPETKFLTVDQFAAYQKEVDTKLAETQRKAQGMVDKSANRLEQRFVEITDPYKRLGYQITPEQELQLRNQILYDEVARQSQPYQQQAPAQVQPVEKVDQVSVKAQGILESFDVQADKSSPNYAKINLQTSDPKVFLASVKEYAQAEASRKEQEKAKPTPPPEAQLPIGGEGKAGNLQSEYEQKLSKIPRGSSSALARQQLKVEFQKKGLKI